MVNNYFQVIKLLRNKSLIFKLISGAILSTIIPFRISGILIYFQLSNSLMDLSLEKLLHNAQDLSQILDENLNTYIKIASTVATSPEISIAVKERNFNKMQEVLDTIQVKIEKDNNFILFF